MISDARENILIQCLTLTLSEALMWYEKAIAKDRAVDVYNIKESELGYYIITSRVILKTPEQEELVRKFISK